MARSRDMEKSHDLLLKYYNRLQSRNFRLCFQYLFQEVGFMKRVIVLFVLLFAWLQAAQAGGFQIGEMSSRSTGMGSAFTAVADDASAAWHNPAGAAFSSGSELLLGGAAIIVPSADFSSNTFNPSHPVSTSASSQAFFVPHGYFTFMDQGSRLGATLGINAPFGLETDWPATGPFATKITFSRIQMVMINPSIVFKFTDNIAIAAGVDYAYINNVDLNNTLQQMNGNGDGWGGNASIMYKDDTFSFGVTYRSSIKVDVDGVARAFSTLATLGGTTSAATSKITLPYQLNVGLTFRPSSDWIISFDVDSVGWQSYDSVKITYASAAYRTAVATLQGAVGAAPTGATYLPQNWKRTTAIRVGAEWAYNARMRARFGYVYDPTPINDVDFSPSVPGNDRQLFSVGYGYDFNPNATIDLAYAYVYFKNRDQTASPATPAVAPNSVKNGLYKSDSHIVAASFSYKF
jgi:long-chain fatty acid transport protein